ncbi:hypothetical protein [Thermococcus pacificus]|uniref:NIF system FeS cluster assembly NifU C-terminal domain-containing protein n=1 Tax=Thermococcus pacificus TaxID=71998 RepID=A0A218P8H5_9EURY|nr:hypothetical protein [Thermococcus pacificus]ASJ07091.1 hypothetical protein A3L08_07025 [Thermococcus pacificus]
MGDKFERLRRVIDEFNRLHGSEAESSIVSVDGNEVIIEFEGSFCATCGLYDYFDDIKWEALDFGLEIEPVEVIEAEEDEFEHGRYVVRYRLGRKSMLVPIPRKADKG